METMRTISEWFTATLVLVGVLLSALSALGLIRLPDAYTRSHAASKSATMGVLCILTGVFIYFMVSLEQVSMKLLLGIVFVFITSPVAGHLNGRAAYRTGVAMWNRSVRDDLQEAINKKPSSPSDNKPNP